MTVFFNLHPELKNYFETKKISSIQELNLTLLDDFFYEYNVNPLGQIRILKTFEELNTYIESKEEMNIEQSDSEIYSKSLEDSNHDIQLETNSDNLDTLKYNHVEPLLSTTIEKLNLSPRATNALIKNDIRTSDQMINLTEIDISKMQNIGKKTFNEILSAIKELEPHKIKYPIERLFIDGVLFYSKEKVSILSKDYWKYYHCLEMIHIIEFVKLTLDVKNNPYFHYPKKLLTYEKFVMIYEKFFEYLLTNLQEQSFTKVKNKEEDLKIVDQNRIFRLDELMREYYNAS